MKIKKIAVLVGMGVAFSGVGASAFASTPWIGSADYTAAIPESTGDEETVGPFNNYDFGTGVVLLNNTGANAYDGYFQSYVTQHELNATPVSAPKLNSTYELTAQATFKETVTWSGSTGTINVTGGTFNLYFDSVVDRNFAGDSGFNDGGAILTGTIMSGNGAAFDFGGGIVFGVTNLDIKITSFDANVFNPDNIVAGESIFTLRLGSPTDASFLNQVSSVMGQSAAGNLKFAADGNIALAVPEAETWAMMLAGLGLVGLQLRRKGKVAKEIAVN